MTSISVFPLFIHVKHTHTVTLWPSEHTQLSGDCHSSCGLKGHNHRPLSRSIVSGIYSMLSLPSGKAEEQWEMLIGRLKDDERLDIYRQYCYHEQTIRDSSPYPGCHTHKLLSVHVTTSAILHWNKYTYTYRLHIYIQDSKELNLFEIHFFFLTM